MLLIKIILVVFSYGVNMYIVPKIYISCVYAVISIFQRTLFCSSARSVVCPQADVICTCGALYVAKPRWLAIGYWRWDALSPHRLIALLPHFQRALELGEEADIQIAILVHIRRQSVHIQYPVSLRRYRHVRVYVSVIRC